MKVKVDTRLDSDLLCRFKAVVAWKRRRDSRYTAERAFAEAVATKTAALELEMYTALDRLQELPIAPVIRKLPAGRPKRRVEVVEEVVLVLPPRKKLAKQIEVLP